MMYKKIYNYIILAALLSNVVSFAMQHGAMQSNSKSDNKRNNIKRETIKKISIQDRSVAPKTQEALLPFRAIYHAAPNKTEKMKICCFAVLGFFRDIYENIAKNLAAKQVAQKQYGIPQEMFYLFDDIQNNTALTQEPQYEDVELLTIGENYVDTDSEWDGEIDMTSGEETQSDIQSDEASELTSDMHDDLGDGVCVDDDLEQFFSFMSDKESGSKKGLAINNTPNSKEFCDIDSLFL